MDEAEIWKITGVFLGVLAAIPVVVYYRPKKEWFYNSKMKLVTVAVLLAGMGAVEMIRIFWFYLRRL